jgi:GGDEF domain-containing protein
MSGFMVLVLLTVIVVIYALINIQRLNNLNSSIVTIDVPVQEASDKMLEAIIAQDTYEKRYLILNSADMQRLYRKRGDEFRQWLNTVQQLRRNGYERLGQIGPLHAEYTALFEKEVKLIKAGKRDSATRISNGALKRKSESIIQLLREMSVAAIESRDDKMQRISFIGRSAFLMTAVLSILSILLGIIGSLVITHHISSSLNKLSIATRQIAEGNFDYDPEIRTQDEIGSLAAAFLDMGKRLKKLEEMYLDASPLTRLPGGIAIENVLKKRIEAKQPLAFCMIDLDNFKSFNDRYGYAQGSELLKETAHIIEGAVRTKGVVEDFIGHVGGDDFVMITTPDRMRAICEEIIANFDRRMPDFYEEKDRKNGYILGKTRQGVEMKFPIITISIAIVTNEHRQISSPLEASEIAAELKDYAKTLPKSIYVIDKRRSA